jgi:DNA-binding transcriptional LysR family regulator
VAAGSFPSKCAVVSRSTMALMMTLALKGMGLIYTADLFAAREVAAGQLESVLHEFLPTSPGLFLYFPARTQIQPKLRAFIDMLTVQKRQRLPRRRSVGSVS